MKKHYSLTISIILLLICLIIIEDTQGQWISPGSGITYTLNDLVDESNGTVVLVEGSFQFTSDLTLSTTDTLKILDDNICLIEANVLLTFQGVLISDPPNESSFNIVDGSSNYLGFRFEESDASVMRNTVVTGGGGISLLYFSEKATSYHITEFALPAFISIEGLLRSQISEGHTATRDELPILP